MPRACNDGPADGFAAAAAGEFSVFCAAFASFESASTSFVTLRK